MEFSFNKLKTFCMMYFTSIWQKHFKNCTCCLKTRTFTIYFPTGSGQREYLNINEKMTQRMVAHFLILPAKQKSMSLAWVDEQSLNVDCTGPRVQVQMYVHPVNSALLTPSCVKPGFLKKQEIFLNQELQVNND